MEKVRNIDVIHKDTRWVQQAGTQGTKLPSQFYILNNWCF